MGLFGMFSKSLEDKINKYFKENKLSLKKQGDKFYFDLYFPNEKYTLTPYFELGTGNLVVFMVNIKKFDDVSLDILNKVNDFNLKSEFFKAQIKNNVLYLHYECYLDGSEKETFGVILSSLNPLSGLIDEF